MRVNPRGVILDALREGPQPLHGRKGLAVAITSIVREQMAIPYFEAVCLGQHHLCRLIRNKQVVRLKDGRYAFRKGPFIWNPSPPVRVEVRIVGAERVISDCKRIAAGAAEIQAYLDARRPIQ